MGLNYGKWEKHKILSTRLRNQLPDTVPFSDQNLLTFLKRYKSVILKPVHGSGGAGIMEVRTQGNQYEIHYEKSKFVLSDEHKLIKTLHKRITGIRYMIQQKVDIARINGRPFDIRVMVQRKKGGPWSVTGKLAKVAGSGYIVTNVHRSHGSVLPLDKAIVKAFQKMDTSLINHIDWVAITAAKELSQKYKEIRILGFDIAIDQNKKIWIIEANFSPQIGMFNYLSDKSMYRKIIAYKKD